MSLKYATVSEPVHISVTMLFALLVSGVGGYHAEIDGVGVAAGVQGFGLRVSGFGVRVSGFGFQAWSEDSAHVGAIGLALEPLAW